MIESSLLVWVIASVAFSSAALMFLSLYNKYNDDIATNIYPLLGLGGPLLSLICSISLIYTLLNSETYLYYSIFTWLDIEGVVINASLLLDPLSAAMLSFVSSVGFIIHLYAHAYMDNDPSYPRFFAWFNLFMAAMFLLILADNPFMLFIGWEGVGLCSYLLISYYFGDEQNVQAGNKAFILNRIGDFGFISGLSLLIIYLGDRGLDFASLEANIHLIPSSLISLISVLLFIGAMGKSAQIPLYVWLPDAMAGPTPVSALIHAATMVTAGVYMIARFHFLYALSEEVGLFIAYIGSFSALLAALIALRQDDIKKILAYSTMSQLGYMFMAVGLGAYSYGIFHVFTHAFFKALLFMGAGAIILALHHEQNIKKMGALKSTMPFLFAIMLLATLAICGIPPFSGFFSKDAIINHLFASGHFDIYAVSLVTAALTGYYMFRLLLIVFIAPAKHEHAVPSQNQLIKLTLFILALGILLSGFINLPVLFGGNENFSIWLNLPDIRHYLSHSDETVLLLVNISSSLLGILMAFIHYKNSSDDPSFGVVERWIKNRFYIDKSYTMMFVRPIGFLSRLIVFLDEQLIDRLIHKIASSYQRLSYYSDYVQNGNARYYALYMGIGIVSIFIYLGIQG